jgi:hypothetical protein
MWRPQIAKSDLSAHRLDAWGGFTFASDVALNQERQMKQQHGFSPIYARPADRSLAAYKEFITSILAAVNPDAPDDKDDQWWQDAWQEFWRAADAVPQAGREQGPL